MGKCQVFGCLVVAKVHACLTKADKVTEESPVKKPRTALTPKSTIQRGVRGIFVGLSDTQAGWLVQIMSSNETLMSVNVAFDEHFA